VFGNVPRAEARPPLGAWRNDWRNAARPRTILVGKVLVSMRAVIAIAFAASLMAASNAEAVTPARVIDKTFICSTSTVGAGIHAFKVGPGWVITPPGSQKDLATVYVDRDGQLVYARDRCRATPIRVPLNRGALPGPDIFGYSYSCVLPGEILVRARRSRLSIWTIRSWRCACTSGASQSLTPR